MTQNIGGVSNQLYVGAKPWHGGGRAIAEGQTVVESIKQDPILASKIDRCPTQFMHYDMTMADDDQAFVHVRRADKRVVGRGGPSYVVTQHLDLAAFADRVAEGLGARFEIAGTLRRGSQFVLQAKVGNDAVVRELRNGKPDDLSCYLTLGTSHDGDKPTEIGFATVRAECWNMTAMAMKDVRSGKLGVRYFAMRHTGDLKAKLKDAEEAMAAGLQAWAGFQQFSIKAAATTMPASDFGDFTLSLFPDVKGANNSRVASKRSQLTQLFASGRGNDGISAWDAYNAVTEYTNYFASVRGVDSDAERNESRITSTLYGQGAQLAVTAEQELRLYLSM